MRTFGNSLAVGLGIAALGEVGASKEFSEFGILDNHTRPAFLANYVRFLALGLDLALVLDFEYLVVEVGIEVGNNVIPFDIALFYLIEIVFHIGGKLGIHNLGEVLFELFADEFSEFGRFHIFTVFFDIRTLIEYGDSLFESGRTTYAVFFHGFDERAVGISLRRLGKFLFARYILEIEIFARIEIG